MNALSGSVVGVCVLVLGLSACAPAPLTVRSYAPYTSGLVSVHEATRYRDGQLLYSKHTTRRFVGFKNLNGERVLHFHFRAELHGATGQRAKTAYSMFQRVTDDRSFTRAVQADGAALELLNPDFIDLRAPLKAGGSWKFRWDAMSLRAADGKPVPLHYRARIAAVGVEVDVAGDRLERCVKVAMLAVAAGPVTIKCRNGHALPSNVAGRYTFVMCPRVGVVLESATERAVLRGSEPPALCREYRSSSKMVELRHPADR